MYSYLLRRMMLTVVTLFVLMSMVFVLIRISGDATTLLVPLDSEPEDRIAIMESLGLDKSIPEQYVRYFAAAATGDLGESYHWHDPALSVITARLWATVSLAGASFIVAVLLSIPFGILAAVYRDSWIDVASRFVAVLGQSIPDFWMGILLILIFSVWLGWLPSFGRGDGFSFSHFILPAITLSSYTAASQMRLTRSAMLDVLDSDYVRMARLKGLPNRRVILVHALRNAAIPIVTLMGIRLGRLLSGAVVVEVIFAWPGVGRTMVEAILSRDFPVAQAGVLIIGLIFVISNFLVDISYGALDPRVRG